MNVHGCKHCLSANVPVCVCVSLSAHCRPVSISICTGLCSPYFNDVLDLHATSHSVESILWRSLHPELSLSLKHTHNFIPLST